MKLVLLAVCIASSIPGCGRSPTADPVAVSGDKKPAIRVLTFRSHLRGALDADPEVHPGETIRVTPDATEPTTEHESILVQLPRQTPFTKLDELYYLRGFAVGRLSAHNGQFL